MSYNLGPVKPWVAAAANEIGGKFGISTIGGYRAGARDPNGHPAGRALDFMVTDVKRGTALAEYARANARRLGVEYVIWRQKIWSAGRNGEGWRPMPDRGSPTQNHMDHVHVNFTATAPAGGKIVSTPTATWTPNSKRVGDPATGDRVGAQNGAHGAVKAVAQLPALETIRDVAIVAAAMFGGVALIVLGTAAAAVRHTKNTAPSKEDAAQLLSLLPQGRAAKAAGAATASTTTAKGTR